MTTLTSTADATQSVVAVYKTHSEAEDAVRLLTGAGVPVKQISIVGKDWQSREDVQGYYQPADAIKDAAGSGAWFGGLFGMLLGFGLFVVPVAGALIVLGPLSGLIAGAIGGAGLGALVGGLAGLGIPKDQALKYQVRLEAGEFLVIVNGTTEDIENAHKTLSGSGHVDIQVHQPAAA
jgi:hypothetical protein